MYPPRRRTGASDAAPRSGVRLPARTSRRRSASAPRQTMRRPAPTRLACRVRPLAFSRHCLANRNHGHTLMMGFSLMRLNSMTGDQMQYSGIGLDVKRRTFPACDRLLHCPGCSPADRRSGSAPDPAATARADTSGQLGRRHQRRDSLRRAGAWSYPAGRHRPHVKKGPDSAVLRQTTKRLGEAVPGVVTAADKRPSRCSHPGRMRRPRGQRL